MELLILRFTLNYFSSSVKTDPAKLLVTFDHCVDH